MTQRKTILTSAAALATRPCYVQSRNVVKQNQVEQAQPARAAERSEADSVTSVVGPPSRARAIRPLSLISSDTGIRIGSGSRGQGEKEKGNRTRKQRRQTNCETWALLNKLNTIETTEISGFLAKLNKEQKQDLLDRLALENVKGADNRDLDMWSVGVARALADAIGVSDREAYGQMLCKRQLGLSSTWRPIEEFMRSSGLADLVVVERQAVYNLLAQLVVEAAGFTARRSGTPLSLKLTAQHTPSVAGIFERAFPGYVAAGLAQVVVRQSLRV